MIRLFVLMMICVLVVSGCSAEVVESWTGYDIDAKEVEVEPQVEPEEVVVDRNRVDGQMTISEKLAELDFIYEMMENEYLYEESYYDSYVRWKERKDYYIEQIEGTESDLEYQYRLNQIMHGVNNPFVGMLDEGRYEIYYHYFKDSDQQKIWKVLTQDMVQQRYNANSSVFENDKDFDTFVMDDNMSTEILVEGKVAYIGFESFTWGNIEPDRLVISNFLKEVANYEYLILDVSDNKGGAQKYWAEMLLPMMLQDQVTIRGQVGIKGTYGADFFEEIVENNEDNLFGLDSSIIGHVMGEDMLDDFGYFGVSELTITPVDQPLFSGSIVVYTSEQTRPTADLFAMFVKESGVGKVAGSPMSIESGISSAIYALPYSGLLITIPVAETIGFNGKPYVESSIPVDLTVNSLEELVDALMNE